MKKIMLLIAFAILSFVQVNAQVVTIGTGTEDDDGLPIDPSYRYSYSQCLYLASEINQTGNIYRIKYKGESGISISSSNDWTVYMGHTSNTTLATNGWIPASSMTQVFTGAITVVNDNVEIILTTPFSYNGTDNLVIAIDENQMGYDGGSDDFLSTNVTGQRSLLHKSNSSNPDPANMLPFSSIGKNAVANIDLDFTNPCITISSFPFIEEFETITTGQPNCWGISGTTTLASYHWNSFSTGSQGKGMRFNSFGNPSGNTSKLTTPTFDLSSLSTAQLSFDFKNPEGGDFEVLISTDGGITYTSLENNLTAQNTWLQKTYNITSYIGSNVKIQFKGTSNYGLGASTSHIFLDKVILSAVSTCSAPISLTTSNITTTSTDLSWTAGGTGGTSWQVEYGTTGFTQGTGTKIITSSNSYALSGLTPSTTYDWYVREICGAGDTSFWTSANTFSTICTPYIIPYFEGFESGYTNGNTVAGCITEIDVQGVSNWKTNNTATSFNRAPRTGNWNAFLLYSNENWMLIPVQLNGGTSYTVQVFARQNTDDTDTELSISYGNIGTVAGMTNTIVAPTGIVDGNYQEITGAFTPTTTGVYYVGIKGDVDYSAFSLSIDDIKITETSAACVSPNSLTANNITESSAKLSWTENGAATQWQIEWGEEDFNQGTGTLVVTSDNPYTLNGLDEDEDYEFYVRSICSVGDTSAWSSAFEFETEETSGISEILNESVRVFPNPSNGVITVESNKTHLNLSICDLSGNVVYQCFMVSKQKAIDLKHIEKGVYFLKIEDKSLKIVVK